MHRRLLIGVTVVGGLAALAGAERWPASFHLMKIEQVVGGVHGDVSAQAVQLQMRAGGQRFLASSRLVAYDAAGENPVVLIDFESSVDNGSLGDRVLVVSPGFDPALTDPPLVADFVMTGAIPESYLDAGRITFENNSGSRVLWSLAYGGSAYTGDTTGDLDNDLDGEFGPAYPDPLPTGDASGLLFQGAASDRSTNNADDYDLSDPAVLTNNARASFTIVGAPCKGDFNGDGAVNTLDVLAFLNAWSAGDPSADCNGDGVVNTQDVLAFLNAWTAGC